MGHYPRAIRNRITFAEFKRMAQAKATDVETFRYYFAVGEDEIASLLEAPYEKEAS